MFAIETYIDHFCIVLYFFLFFSGLKSRTDAVFLLSFLRVAKFDQEKAFARILKYYTMRKDYAYILTGLKPSALHHVLSGCQFSIPLNHRDTHGRLVSIIRPGKLDFERFDADDIIKRCFIQNYKTMMVKMFL